MEITIPELAEINKKLDRILSLLEERPTVEEPDTPGRRLLTVEEAAVYIGVAKQSIYHMTSSRSIPHVKIGKRVMFDPDDLDRWIAKRRVRTIG